MYLVWEEENFIFSYLFTFALYLTLELLYKKNICVELNHSISSQISQRAQVMPFPSKA